MNARQKAKHFKMLYEMGLPKKPYPVVYKSVLPIRYKLQCGIDMNDIVHLHGNSQLIKSLIEDRILEELKPLLWNNLEISKTYWGMYRCCLDIYFNSEGSEESDKNKEALSHMEVFVP